MSILTQNKNIYVISHENYINKIYEKEKTNKNNFEVMNQETANYKINKQLFDINSVYLKDNQEVYDDCDPPPSRKRKRNNKSNETPEEYKELLETVIRLEKQFKIFIEENGKKIFPERRKGDNNKTSREFVEKYYSELPELPEMIGGNTSNNVIVADISSEKYLIPPNCLFYQKDVREIEKFLDFDKKYDLIVLDPPWWNKFIRRVKSGEESIGYSMLYNKDIEDIPVRKMTKSSSLVIIWCTNSSSHINAVKSDFLPKWGLKLISTWFWLKITKFGQPICEFRIPPRKQPFEQIFLACHEDSDLTDFEDLLAERILLSVPSAIHSNKPPLVDLIKDYLPINPDCLEIFARYLLPNFTSIGLESLKLQNLKLFEE